MKAYQSLERRFNTLHQLGSALSILHWDAAVMMPPGSADVRAEQFAALESLSHEMLTSNETGDLIEAAAQEKDLNDWQRSNVRLMKHGYVHATATPAEIVPVMARARTECEMVWREARKANDFKRYLPIQQKVLELTRQVAAAKAEALKCSMYDAMLDGFDPGRTSAEIDVIFNDLRAFLPAFTVQVIERQKQSQKPQALGEHFPVEKQQALGRFFMEALGFDLNTGRIDTSAHPFCGGVPGDVRITTRYNEKDFTSALMGVLHETGHALYEAGLPKEWRSQPVGHALGMSMHESQSLLTEMQVCRSKEFLTFAAPIIAEAFGGKGTAWGEENLYQLYSEVEPGLIRVDADEVTYPSHIILRYDLEKDLIAGKIEMKDVPERWNIDMKRLLNVDVPSDAMGCMQDIHWTDGSFGYFPCYTLGAMTAAQFFNAAKKQIPGLMEHIAKGQFKPLTDWLKTNIHSKGSALTTEELMRQVTGEPLNADIYKAHLKARYLA